MLRPVTPFLHLHPLAAKVSENSIETSHGECFSFAIDNTRFMATYLRANKCESGCGITAELLLDVSVDLSTSTTAYTTNATAIRL